MVFLDFKVMTGIQQREAQIQDWLDKFSGMDDALGIDKPQTMTDVLGVLLWRPGSSAR